MPSLYNQIRDSLFAMDNILAEWQHTGAAVPREIVDLVENHPPIDMTDEFHEKPYVPFEGVDRVAQRDQSDYQGRLRHQLNAIRHAVSQAGGVSEREFRKSFIKWKEEIEKKLSATQT